MRGNARVVLLLAIDGWLLWARCPNWTAVGDCVTRATRAQASYGADRYVSVLAGAALWLAAGWLAIGLAAIMLGALPGRGGSVARAIATSVMPRAIRTVLVAVTTTSVSLSAATGTAAATGSHGTPVPPGRPAATSPAWPIQPTQPTQPALPALPTQPAPPSAPAGQPSAGSTATGEQVLVRPGDSLWLIAARHLRAGASGTEIAALWPRWFADNRTVIGDDPNLLHPGTKLVNPEASAR